MIELFFVFFFIPRRIKALAKLRGENWIRWSLFAIGAWFGAQILAFMAITTVLATYAAIAGSVFNENLAVMIAYFFGLVGAVMAATLVVKQLAKKPLLPIPTEDISK